jgi:hypothetical protein
MGARFVSHTHGLASGIARGFLNVYHPWGKDRQRADARRGGPVLAQFISRTLPQLTAKNTV